MSRSRRAALRGAALLAVLAVAGLTTAARAAGPYGLGRAATPEEVRGWDIDVRADGTGLPPGRGTVAEGQDLYDARCASCHGTFGESNEWLAIAGGVRKGDIARGRAATLAEPNPVRTVGTKQSNAATLWDYINRAMPLTAPKSLTPDEVYALTAYVLHLNEILPADAEVSQQTLPGILMPNRLGFTDRHGFMTVRGRPDVRNTACMKDCERHVTVTSELPEHARNAHGNLREQMRWYGTLRGTDTTLPPGASAARYRTAAVPAPVQDAPGGGVPRLLGQAGCVACHAPDRKLVGPAFAEIAARYRDQAGAASLLVAKLREGGVGVWGQVPMPPQAHVSEADARTLVQWILSVTAP